MPVSHENICDTNCVFVGQKILLFHLKTLIQVRFIALVTLSNIKFPVLQH